MDPSKSTPRSLELRGWLDPAVVALALMAFASGFGQFGAVSALGDVAKTFGHTSHSASLAEQAETLPLPAQERLAAVLSDLEELADPK